MALLVIATTALAMRFILHKPLASMRSPAPGTPSAAYLATNLVASALAALVGGYTTAAVAGRAHLAHGLGLAAVMIVMSLVSMRQAGSSQPRWYQWVFATVMPALAVGGAVLCSVLMASA
jgi:drug/metabolite transporter superfamily protein YnfA